MYLGHHVARVDVGLRRPGLKAGRCCGVLQDVDTAAMKLRAHAAVHQQHLARVQPVGHASSRHSVLLWVARQGQPVRCLSRRLYDVALGERVLRAGGAAAAYDLRALVLPLL